MRLCIITLKDSLRLLDSWCQIPGVVNGLMSVWEGVNVCLGRVHTCPELSSCNLEMSSCLSGKEVMSFWKGDSCLYGKRFISNWKGLLVCLEKGSCLSGQAFMSV